MPEYVGPRISGGTVYSTRFNLTEKTAISKAFELLMQVARVAVSGGEGAPGPAGEDGEDGTDGVDGINGTNGIDASYYQIGIEETVTVPLRYFTEP